jgi:tRNA A-37 threonylcarbamoyl transferase component Bud32
VIREAPLAQRECLINLGQLIAQLDVGEHALADPAIDNYFAQSGWIDSLPLRNSLHQSIRHAWRRRLRDYLRKARRICSLTYFENTFRRLVAHRRGWEGDDLQQFLVDPDRFMAQGQLLKAGNSATVVKAEINGRPVVIKRYNIKNWRHAVARSLRPTRATHSWLYAHLLELVGIRSLVPVALLERRFGPLRSTAYFVAEWIEAPDLLSHPLDTPLNENEVAALRSLLLQMKKCQLSHGDFKANNLLLDGDAIAVIDLDAMHRHRSVHHFARAYKKDIERLRRNWPSGSVLQLQIESLTQEISVAP